MSPVLANGCSDKKSDVQGPEHQQAPCHSREGLPLQLQRRVTC